MTFTVTDSGMNIIRNSIFDHSAPAAASGGIGDVTSNARGTGARFNGGKPDLALIPLQLIAESMRPDGGFNDADRATACEVMVRLADFQQTGKAVHLDAAFGWMSGDWSDCARVFDYGRRKYAAWNWAKGMPWSVPVACAARHLVAIMRGELIDPESGERHAGHVLCNLVMLRTYVTTFPEGNDLPSPELFKARAAQ